MLWRTGFMVVLLASLRAATAQGTQVTGVVRNASGEPVPNAEVVLEIGKARYELTPDFDGWYAVRTEKGKTDGAGRFTFPEVPADASAFVAVKTSDGFATAKAGANLELELAPLGSVVGRAAGKRSLLKGLRLFVRSAGGFDAGEGTVDEDSGRFEVEGMIPGPARIHLLRNNFYVARFDVEVESGKRKRLKPVRLRDRYLPCADPLIDVLKVRLVDSKGDAVQGVQLIWSSRWMDGGMNSDEEGLVRLAGGGVAIGGPPYLLRLSRLEGESGYSHGALRRVRRGVATVEIERLRGVAGAVSRGKEAVEHYLLFVVGPGKDPYVYTAHVEGGRYSVELPEGRCRFFLGTEDGKIHEHEFEVSASGGAGTHDIVLK